MHWQGVGVGRAAVEGTLVSFVLLVVAQGHIFYHEVSCEITSPITHFIGMVCNFRVHWSAVNKISSGGFLFMTLPFLKKPVLPFASCTVIVTLICMPSSDAARQRNSFKSCSD